MKPVVLGPKYAIRLGDLQRWHVIIVDCLACPRRGLVDPEDLRARFSEHEWLTRIEKRFKCKGCGNKVYNSWQIMDIWGAEDAETSR